MTSAELVDCKSLPPGSVLDVETRNRHYQIECLGGSEIRISGHPELCPTPVAGRLQGSSDKQGILEPGVIGRGRYLQFFLEQRPVRTTRVVRLRLQRPGIVSAAQSSSIH